MKVYNVQYHLLRACNPDPLPSPVTTRQGSHLFQNLSSILHVFRENERHVGGLRIEIRVRHTMLMEAVNHLINRELFRPNRFGVNVRYVKIGVPEYLQYETITFRKARAILTHASAMNHMGVREMQPFEKRILGDLKLLLGYRHAGYRTTRGDNYWWLHAAPAIPP